MSEVEKKDGKPKDDGLKSRKFLTAVIGCGVVWLAITAALFFSLFDVAGAAGVAEKLKLTAELWADTSETLLWIAVAGYGITNVAEKFVLTRNK